MTSAITLLPPEAMSLEQVGKIIRNPALAACTNYHPELFFPVGSTGPALQQAEIAKSICYTCPVREHCLRYALEAGMGEGVWGGMSEDERRNLKRRQRKQAAAKRAADESTTKQVA